VANEGRILPEVAMADALLRDLPRDLANLWTASAPTYSVGRIWSVGVGRTAFTGPASAMTALGAVTRG